MRLIQNGRQAYGLGDDMRATAAQVLFLRVCTHFLCLLGASWVLPGSTMVFTKPVWVLALVSFAF